MPRRQLGSPRPGQLLARPRTRRSCSSASFCPQDSFFTPGPNGGPTICRLTYLSLWKALGRRRPALTVILTAQALRYERRRVATAGRRLTLAGVAVTGSRAAPVVLAIHHSSTQLLPPTPAGWWQWWRPARSAAAWQPLATFATRCTRGAAAGSGGGAGWPSRAARAAA